MKVKDLIAELQQMEQDSQVKLEVYDGCAGPDAWYEALDVGYGYDDKTVMLTVNNGCMCSKGNRTSIGDVALHPENFVENPADPSKFTEYSEEELRKGLAYWINLANYRGNKLLSLYADNASMKNAFFDLRRDAFLSRLDRWEVLCLAVKFVGNQVRD